MRLIFGIMVILQGKSEEVVMKESSLCILLLKNWKNMREERVCFIGERGLVFFFPWDYFPLTVCFSKCLS